MTIRDWLRKTKAKLRIPAFKNGITDETKFGNQVRRNNKRNREQLTVMKTGRLKEEMVERGKHSVVINATKRTNIIAYILNAF